MGLFSFFSRKGAGRRKSSVYLKAQHGPIIVNSPPTQDAYLVGGNDPEFSQTELFVDDQGAPAFAVPLFRDDGLERPSTAPSSRPPSISFTTGTSRFKRDGKKRPPPLSFRMPQTGTAAPVSRPSSRGSEKTVTGVLSLPFGRSRASSVQSNSSRGFKDLLDAQSEINPADFRARVKANGARDYGEDVAERNMGENGFDLESAHVRAFYAQPPKAAEDSETSAGVESAKSMGGGGLRPKSFLSLKRSVSSYRSDRALPLNLIHTSQKSLGQSRSINSFMPPGSQDKSVSTVDRSSASPSDALLRFPISGSSLPVVSQRPKTSSGTPARARRLRDSVLLTKKKAEMTPSEENDEDDVPPRVLSRWSVAHPDRMSNLRSADPVPRIYSLHTLQSSVSSSITSRDGVVFPTSLCPPRSSSRQHQQGVVSNIPGEEDVEVPRPPSRTCPPIPTATDIQDEVYESPPPFQTRTLRAWSASSGTPTATESITTTSTSYPFHRPPSLHTADTSIDITLSAVSLLLKPTLSSPGSLSNIRPSSSPTRFDDDDDDDYDETPPAIPSHEPDPTRFNINDYLSSSSSDDETPPAIPTHHQPDATDTDRFNIDDYLSSDDDDSFTTAPNRRPTAEGEEDLLFDDSCFGTRGLGVGLQLPGIADPFPSSSSSSLAAHRRREKMLLRGAKSSPTMSYSGPAGPVFMNDLGYRYETGYGGDEGGSRTGGGYFDMVNWGRRRDLDRRGRVRRRFVLDTAADDEDEEESGPESEWGGDMSGGEEGGMWRGGLDWNLDGYEYGEEGVSVADRISMVRWRRKRRTRRLSALCRGDGEQNQEEQEKESRAEKRRSDADVAAAVRLRKQVKRARRLAGQPSVRMRRAESVKERMGVREAVMVLVG